jgi:hypothetical protein
VYYTVCELRSRLNNYLASVLRGQTTMATGTNSAGLQAILRSLGMEWLPLFSCEKNGAYKLTADLLSVGDKTTVRHVCIDKHGNEEANCSST